MILAVSVVIAVIFGSGAFLVLQRDLLRVVVGIVLVSNSAILFIIAAGLSRGSAPIYPIGEGAVSDPLVQAMALTALVIGSALLLLSAFWHQARAVVVRPLPEGLRGRLPILDRPAVSPQPAA